jgi:hypothetical protein
MAAATTSEIRAWAQANGYDVGDRGRLPVEVTEAYRKGKGKAAPVKAAAAKSAAPASKAAPAATAMPAKKATPVRKPSVIKVVTDTDTAPDEAPPVPVAPAVKGAATPTVSLEDRVATLEQQVAFLKDKADKLAAAPAKRGFGRRR